jgi:hypothetical protein
MMYLLDLPQENAFALMVSQGLGSMRGQFGVLVGFKAQDQ